MKVKETGRGLLREAELRFRTAKSALKGGAHAFAFRQAQECVELSLKGALRGVGVEHPKVHDVSEVLKASAGRFPEWFRSKIEEFGETSTALAERREMSMYGDERRGLAPEQIFGRRDAEDAVARASAILTACKRLSKKAQRES